MRDLKKANEALHYTEGTKLEALKQRISKNNTSGAKGIAIKNIKEKTYYY